MDKMRRANPKRSTSSRAGAAAQAAGDARATPHLDCSTFAIPVTSKEITLRLPARPLNSAARPSVSEAQCLTELTKPLPRSIAALFGATRWNEGIRNDPDTKACLLRLNQGAPDANATWKRLTRAERKQAARLDDFLFSGRVNVRGRPALIDPAMVLYLVLIIERAYGKRFKFSQSTASGEPSGPMFRLLMQALAHHVARARRLAAVRLTAPMHMPAAESIAWIVKVSRRRTFNAWLRRSGIDRCPEAIAGSPNVVRLLYAKSARLS